LSDRERFRELQMNRALHTHTLHIEQALVWSVEGCKACAEIEAIWKRLLDSARDR